MNKWDIIMGFIKEQAEEFHVHIWYSMENQWCYISYRGFRYKINPDTPLNEVQGLIQNIKNNWAVSGREYSHITIE